MALVCPPTPLRGTEQSSTLSPPETTVVRKFQKFLILHTFTRDYLLIPAMKSLVRTWIINPNAMLEFSETQMAAPKDKEWWEKEKEEKRQVFNVCLTSAMQHSATEYDFVTENNTTSIQNEGGDEKIIIKKMTKPKKDRLFNQMVEICLSDLIEATFLFPCNFTNITAPIDIWYGSADTVTPNGKWLAEQIASSRQFKCEGHGHQLLFSRFTDIVSQLVRKE